jgi:hypothetical protein
VDSATRKSQRRAAGAFLVVTLPFAIAIAIAGGLLGLAPLLLLVLPILAIGRAPGVEVLERARARAATPRRVARHIRALRPLFTEPEFRFVGSLLANSLAERGPPLHS